MRAPPLSGRAGRDPGLGATVEPGSGAGPSRGAEGGLPSGSLAAGRGGSVTLSSRGPLALSTRRVRFGEAEIPWGARWIWCSGTSRFRGDVVGVRLEGRPARARLRAGLGTRLVQGALAPARGRPALALAPTGTRILVSATNARKSRTGDHRPSNTGRRGLARGSPRPHSRPGGQGASVVTALCAGKRGCQEVVFLGSFVGE